VIQAGGKIGSAHFSAACQKFNSSTARLLVFEGICDFAERIGKINFRAKLVETVLCLPAEFRLHVLYSSSRKTPNPTGVLNSKIPRAFWSPSGH
jgi:hypothetical protein